MLMGRACPHSPVTHTHPGSNRNLLTHTQLPRQACRGRSASSLHLTRHGAALAILGLGGGRSCTAWRLLPVQVGSPVEEEVQGSAGRASGRAGTALSPRGVCLGPGSPTDPGGWGFRKICGNPGRGCGERSLLTSQSQPPVPFYTRGTLSLGLLAASGKHMGAGQWGRGSVIDISPRRLTKLPLDPSPVPNAEPKPW